MNQILTSKQDGIGVVNQNAPYNKVVREQKGTLNLPRCSYESDSVTTYVLKSVWHQELNSFLFPPYVECEYVD